MSKSQLAVILPAAVLQLFPNTKLKGGGPTSWGFYYDFDFPLPFQSHFLTLIEDRMQLLKKKKDSLRAVEMVKGNASERLRAYGQEKRAQQVLLAAGPIVKMAQFEEFIDFCDFPLTYEVSDFRLLEVIGQTTVRIIGVGGKTKDELKTFVKSWTGMKGKTHQELAQTLSFLTPASTGWIWLPKGESIRQGLIEVWKRFFLSQGFELISTPSNTSLEMLKNHTAIGQKTAEISFISTSPEGDDGLFTPMKGFVDQAYVFNNSSNGSDFLISFLQFVVKFLRMLRFDYEVVLCGKQTNLLQGALKSCSLDAIADKGAENGIEFYLRDALGRKWKGPYIRSERHITIVSLFFSMERLVGLLLEQTRGALPFWLAPQQIRLLSLGKESGQELYSRLKKEGWRVFLDVQKRPLKQRIHEALREGVPYSIVLGEKENKAGMVAVREYGSELPVRMGLETLISRLKELENQ